MEFSFKAPLRKSMTSKHCQSIYYDTLKKAKNMVLSLEQYDTNHNKSLFHITSVDKYEK